MAALFLTDVPIIGEPPVNDRELEALLMELVEGLRQEINALTISVEEWLALACDDEVARQSIAHRYLLSRNPSGRRLCRSPRVKRRIVEMLNAQELRFGALLALWKIRTSDAIPALLHVLREDPDVIARCAASNALGNQRNPLTVAPILDVIADPSTPLSLAENCIRALGEIGDPSAVPGLLSLISRPEWQIRWALAIALRQLGDPASTSLMRDLCSDRRVPSDLRGRGRVWLRRWDPHRDGLPSENWIWLDE